MLNTGACWPENVWSEEKTNVKSLAYFHLLKCLTLLWPEQTSKSLCTVNPSPLFQLQQRLSKTKAQSERRKCDLECLKCTFAAWACLCSWLTSWVTWWLLRTQCDGMCADRQPVCVLLGSVSLGMLERCVPWRQGGECYTDLVASNSKPSNPSHHPFINSNNIRNEVFSFVLIFSKCGRLNTNVDIHNAPRCYMRQNIECILGRKSLWKDILAMVD